MSERCWDHKTTGDGSQGFHPLLAVAVQEYPYWIKELRGNVIQIDLPPDSEEYIDIASLVQTTLKVKITNIQRIFNPYTWGCYLLKRDECISRVLSLEEQTLFHATNTENVNSILQTNFDWRKATRTKFGKGVSFSSTAYYANKHCNQLNGLHRAMLITRVLVGNVCPGHQLNELPESYCDTTRGNDNQAFVKFYDNEFYPEYVVFYEATTRKLK